MAKEYSIYFENRRVLLTENIETHFINEFGLFASYSSPHELPKILEFFQTIREVKNVFITGKKGDVLYEDFSSLFPLIKTAGGLVVNSKGEYLLIFRRGKWDLPKGKQELGEKIEKSALREVSEETGITNMKIINRLNDTYHTYFLEEMLILKKTAWFEMQYDGNEPLVPQQNEDILDVKWVKKEHLSKYLENTYNTIYEVFLSAGIV